MYLLLENPYHSLLHTNIIWQLTAFISELMLYSYLSSTFVQSESLSRAVFWLIFMSHNICLSQSHKLYPHPHTRPLRPILLHTFRKCHWCLLFQNPGRERSNLASGSSWSCTCRSHQLWPVLLGLRQRQGRFGMLLVRHRVAGLGRLSSGAKMAMKPFVKSVFTIFATNASFLRVISNFRI